MMAITLEQAKSLRSGQTLHHVANKNADGTPQRWRVTSVKTWKTPRNAHRVEIHVKHGLKNYDFVTETGLGLLSIPD